MKRLVTGGARAFALWVCAGALFAGHDAWAQDTHSREVAEMMELSGINHSLNQMPDAVRGQMAQRKGQLPVQVEAKLQAILLDAYQPDKLKVYFAAVLEAGFDETVYLKSREWLTSPLGKRFTQLEAVAATPQGQAQIAQWSQDFGGKPPTQERALLIGRLLRASNGVGVAIEAVVTVTEPIVQTANALAPEEQRQSQEDIEALLDSVRQQLIEPMAQQMVLAGLFMYREVGDADLVKYAEFLESPHGAAFQEQMNVALITALAESNGVFAERFGEIFQ